MHKDKNTEVYSNCCYVEIKDADALSEMFNKLAAGQSVKAESESHMKLMNNIAFDVVSKSNR